MENFNSEVHPGDFEIGSTESRAAARARLQSALSIFILLVDSPPRDVQGNVLPHPEPEIISAECGRMRYDRLPGESVEALKARVLADRPVGMQIVLLNQAPIS